MKAVGPPLMYWESKFVTSYQALEGEWYMCSLGNTQMISHAAGMLVTELLDEDDMGIRCPNQHEIQEACEQLSHAGIPTLRIDGCLQNDGWTGEPINPASLISALKIFKGKATTKATVLITACGMVRVAINSNKANGDSAKVRATTLAHLLRAFGSQTFARCRTKERIDSCTDTEIGISWCEESYIPIDERQHDLYVRFSLWGDSKFKHGLWVGGNQIGNRESPLREVFYSTTVQNAFNNRDPRYTSR